MSTTSTRSKSSEAVKNLKRFARRRVAVVGAVLVMLFVFAAAFAPLLTPWDPNKQDLTNILSLPGDGHPLGTDELGRDIWARILYGARVSLWVGVLAVAIAVALGILTGAVAGYFGGIVDDVLMRIMDVFLAFPGVLLTVVLVIIMGPSVRNVAISVGLYRLPTFARLARGEVLGVKDSEFIEASKALGASDLWIILTHIIPNIVSPVIVLATLSVADSILTASGMGFLGFGAPPHIPEWGAMLSNGRRYLLVAPHAATYPGLAILLLLLGLNLVGDGIRDVLDPKMRG